MKCSVEMKNSLVIVFFTLSIVHIWGGNLNPNVKLTFSTISNDPAILYHVYPIKNMDIYDETLISLKAIKNGSCQGWCWFLNMRNKSTKAYKRNCDNLIIPMKELTATLQDFHDIKPLHYEGQLFEIFKVFRTEIDMHVFMDFNGCQPNQRLKNYDERMEKNKLIFIIYKHGESRTLNIWNTSFTIYNYLYGLLQIVNDETIENSAEEYKGPISYSVMFCQSEVSAETAITYYRTNENNGLFIVLSTTIVAFIIFFILISKCSHYFNTFIED